MTRRHVQIGMLLFPRLTQLDLTAPFEVFTRVHEADVHLVWTALDPIAATPACASCQR